VNTEADALHREALALVSEQRQLIANQQTVQIMELLQQNTMLTEMTKDLSLRIKELTSQIHGKFLRNSGKNSAS
jgi:UDP-N-acetylglucosamine:LPS N-acetylglucosamine transferase